MPLKRVAKGYALRHGHFLAWELKALGECHENYS
jgi:hypothetical protein